MIPQLNSLLNLVTSLSFKDWLFVIIIALISYIGWLKFAEIPSIEETHQVKYDELTTQYEDLLDQVTKPPTVTLKEGETQKTPVADTTERSLEGSTPQQEDSLFSFPLCQIPSHQSDSLEKDSLNWEKQNYFSTVEDTLIKGTVRATMVGPGYIQQMGLDYRLQKPIFALNRVDTLIKTKTITLTKWRDRDPKWYFNAGAFAQWDNTRKEPGIGPKVLVISPQLQTYSASWDVLNDSYMVGITFNF